MGLYDMRVFTDEGVIVFSIDDWYERSVVGSYWNAVRTFLGSGDVESLVQFERETVQGHRLQTDPDEIERWAMQGELDFEDIYE
jgi:hypothetical protein